ncbi:MAG: tripartite tricarboxylate transporter TctB family protein [Pyramidobacter sp.]|nr:tripartite tricarboxylate transporter TctB family protein [Pyramidobacter sp.]MBP3752612.1 tripartite tricarboxylate transporter TctB family protein [Pyramidobacter sp.]
MSYFLKHLLFSLFAVAVGLYFYIQAGTMPASAALFPQLVSGLIFVLAAVMSFNAWRSAPPEAQGAKINVARVCIYGAMIAVYIAVTEKAGYFVSTPVFMLISYLYLRAAGFIKAVFLSVFFCAFVYLVFVWFLNLPVPLGLLEPLLGA